MNIIQSQVFIRADFKTDIIHYSNEGVCSWYDFAKTILRLRNIQCRISPTETTNYPTPARRPHYSVLDKSKIKRLYDLEIPYWKDSVKRCLIALQDKI